MHQDIDYHDHYPHRYQQKQIAPKKYISIFAWILSFKHLTHL